MAKEKDLKRTRDLELDKLMNRVEPTAIIDEEEEQLKLIEKDEEGEYAVVDKAISISVMEFTVKSKGEDFVPSWSVASKILGVPTSTLQDWWKDKDEIMQAAGSSIEMLPQIITTKMLYLQLEGMHEIKRRGLECWSNKDLLAMVKEFYHIVRLQAGLSNLNVAVGVGFCDGHVKLPK